MAQVSSKIRLLTASEAGALVAVSAPTIRKWADDGKIPYLKLPNGEYRIPLNGLLASLGGTYKLADEMAKLSKDTEGISEGDVQRALSELPHR